MALRGRTTSARLLDLLTDELPPVAPPGRRTGIEHEFAVVGPQGQVDFRDWVRAGLVPGERLDDGDPCSHRQGHGGVITLDGREAEIATAPSPLAPGVTAALTDSLLRLRGDLTATIAPYTARGVSTHLNVEVEDREAPRVARRFVSRHSAAMMLLLDRRESPGLLVRPRRRRLEVGGEYAVGPQLSAAMVFAGAAALDCRRPHGRRRPLARPAVVPAVHRYGWYVDRTAFGGDLYRGGRQDRVGPYRAQDLLEESWDRVRGLAEQVVSEAEVALVDAVVSGAHPLPCESPDVEEEHGGASGLVSSRASRDDLTRREARVRSVARNWDWSLFALARGGRRRYLALPTERSEAFVDALGRGTLDAWVEAVLAAPDRALPVLAGTAQLGPDGGVFGRLGPGLTLAAAERDVRTGRLPAGRPPGGGREHKHEAAESASMGGASGAASHLGRLLRHWQVVAAGSAAVLVTGGAATTLVLQVAGDSDGRPSSGVVAPRAGDPALVPAPLDASAAANARLARAFAGTYDVVVTVTDGNESVPVGSVSERTVTLRSVCNERGTCTLIVDGLAGTVSGGRFQTQGTEKTQCPDDAPGGPVDNRYEMLLEPTGDPAAPTGLVGTVRVETLNVKRCQGAVSDPIAMRWEGTRR